MEAPRQSERDGISARVTDNAACLAPCAGAADGIGWADRVRGRATRISPITRALVHHVAGDATGPSRGPSAGTAVSASLASMLVAGFEDQIRRCEAFLVNRLKMRPQLRWLNPPAAHLDIARRETSARRDSPIHPLWPNKLETEPHPQHHDKHEANPDRRLNQMHSGRRAQPSQVGGCASVYASYGRFVLVGTDCCAERAQR